MSSLFVGIDSWVIQDGNYPDLAVGQSLAFALEFRPLAVNPTKTAVVTCRRLEANRYRVDARVLYASDDFWVIESGFRAYEGRQPPRFAKRNEFVSAEIQLGIDPFFFRSELCHRPGVPPLEREYRVESLSMTARDAGGFEGAVEIFETRAVDDLDGRAYYVAECEVVDRPRAPR